MSTALIVTGIVLCGLVAGLFWGWAIAVGPGLAKVSDHTYVSAMQSINVVIVNPIFLVAFVGAGLVLGAAAIVEFRAGNGRRATWLAAAAASYIVGVFGVTIGGNVPLNDQLGAFQLSGADDDAVAAARIAYEGPWNRLHHLRTVVNVAALAFAGVGAVLPETD